MEVFFVDVGLGSCHVLLLGGQRSIVIDCGVRSDHIALQFLLRNGIKSIDRLITSHSDNDHSSGAVSVLGHYAENIEKICVIQDHRFLKSNYWRRIYALYRERRIGTNQISPPLLPDDDEPKLVWEDVSTGARLRCFSPTYIENLSAQQVRDTNATSMVLVLDYLGKRIVFAADSVIPQWRQIYERRRNKILECDVLAVPHHGGLMKDLAADLDWLYDQALRTEVAIFSVGSVGKPKHPRQEVVTKLRNVGSIVLCTEITNQCHYAPHLLKPGVLQPQTVLGRAMNQPTKQWVACAGTIQVAITNDGCQVDRLATHQQAVDLLAGSSANGVCPLCRMGDS